MQPRHHHTTRVMTLVLLNSLSPQNGGFEMPNDHGFVRVKISSSQDFKEKNEAEVRVVEPTICRLKQVYNATICNYM